ncbi:MAG: hypothetical protein WKF84_00650 [Pyrinomonadaceae bacterium]
MTPAKTPKRGAVGLSPKREPTSNCRRELILYVSAPSAEHSARLVGVERLTGEFALHPEAACYVPRKAERKLPAGQVAALPFTPVDEKREIEINYPCRALLCSSMR